MTTAFDTLETSKHLQDAGFARDQAEAIATAIKSVQGDLATKADIQRLVDKINNLRWTMIVVAGLVVALIKIIP